MLDLRHFPEDFSARINAEICDQNWDQYTAEEHDRWARLHQRQAEVLVGRACDEFLQGLERLRITSHEIPKFNELNTHLFEATGWRIVPVKGLVPDDVFFAFLSMRIFPSTCFIRSEEKFNYLQEPDIFHDTYGHIPMLAHPVFASYLEKFGQMGLSAFAKNKLDYVARIYWYTVEFGLIHTSQGLQIYGSGILSSQGESIFCLESNDPQRLHFDLKRVMRTSYIIDRYQDLYFVIHDLKELFGALDDGFESLFDAVDALQPLGPTDLIEGDVCYIQKDML